MDLSLILPAYRAASLLEKHLPAVQVYLAGLPIQSEILVVDDGSDDGGATRLAADTAGARYLPLPANLGKGAAVRAGMLAASGHVRLFTDADVPYEFDSLERFYDEIANKGAQLAVGDRTLAGSTYFEDIPAIRRIGSRAYSFIVSHLFIGAQFDTQCGIKAFRADVAEDLFGVSQIDRFAIDVELLYIALKRDYNVKRLSVRLRAWEDTGINILRDGFAMLRDMVRIRYNDYRGLYEPVDQES